MAKQIDWPADMNLAFVEGLYADYERDPASVPEEWREYFKQVAPKTSAKANGHRSSTYRPPAASQMAVQPASRPEVTGSVSSASLDVR